MKYLWHFPILIFTFLASIFIIRAWNPFYGMGTGDAMLMIFGGMLLFHLFALIAGFVPIEKTWWRAFVVIAIAMFPAALFSLVEGQNALHLHYVAVYDRFRDNLASPIPESVEDLEFISLEEKHAPNLSFRFKISPDDLDKIIEAKTFVEIDRTQFPRPDDLFIYPEYLPLKEPTKFYIFEDIDQGYPDEGIGELYTLKVSADRREVIFRRESATYYFYRYWEGEDDYARERKFLRSIGVPKEKVAEHQFVENPSVEDDAT